ncbi:MAG: chorismate synthase [Defluviitaleaceae bacterium]|nr:chorismate synthase [Defluviitaleaceae bacterium]
MGSIWKSRISLSIFGQSHGTAIGMTLDGIPAGEAIDLDKLQAFLLRRAPGRSSLSTSRLEEDVPEFISGLVNGVTCGAPITAIIRNNNIRSSDYSDMTDIPRPSHADFTAHVKHNGFQDKSGGGHFSGRLTAPLCIAGGICLQILERHGIFIGTHIYSIGDVCDCVIDTANINKESLLGLSKMELPVFDPNAAAIIKTEIENARKNLDSIGGIIECIAIGLPAGLGEPIFDGMENRIARLVFAIPAVKGVDFGAGFRAADMRGSEHNDPFYRDGEHIKTRTNHNGGILGGITSGMPLVFRTVIKPTPSIGKVQESVYLSRKDPAVLQIQGRHDPCIVPRAVPCIEAAAAIAIYDALCT